MNIRVAVVEDNHLLRAGLIVLLRGAAPGEIDVVGEASSGEQALRIIDECQPDVVLMDIGLPGMDGIETAKLILEARPDTRIVVLSSFSDDAYLNRAIEAGVSGYLLKTATPDTVRAAIRTVAEGDTYFSHEVIQLLAAARRRAPAKRERLSSLTPRHRQVLELTAEGLTSKEIAYRLHLSSKTVDAHRAELMRRLDTFTVAGLVRLAIAEGLVHTS